MTLATLPDARTIGRDDRAAWLAERRTGIGASEAAAVVGLSPYATPLEIYMRKLGLLPEVEPTLAMRIGTLAEPLILQLYRERAAGSCDVDRFAVQQFVRSAERPWMFATLDATRDDGRIVELKTVGWRSARDWGDEGSDEIPTVHLCQVQHQLAVTGHDEADVAALIGGNEFRVYTVRRDEDLIARMVEREAEFWDRVGRREPPPATAADARLLAELYPRPEGAVELDATVLEAVGRFEDLGPIIRDAEQARDEARGRILAALGPAAVGVLPDGRQVVRKVVEIEEHVRRASKQVRLYFKQGNPGG